MIEISTRDECIARHWYLCRRAARRFVRPGLERCDLEQVAAIGLIKAADRYDASSSTPFEAYAWVLMLGELMHFVRDGERLLRAPRRVRDLERRWTAAERELQVALGREPGGSDVVRFLNATPQDEREIREYRASSFVLSYEGLTNPDRRCESGGYDEVLDRMTIDNALSRLPLLEREIVRGIHLEGASVAELAQRLGYSRRHLTRLHRSALTRLRNVC
ncbi:MAG: sigma-70 family RNA polymerase sigma factor [Candidatus Eremiobacteraeota bacterium]|nr:sigma-70 family RNA polymerase sigma factor [Candidatus Eremiobacteraeota bacterium]MBV8433863.1 sigma-70 family RNA polymerase sigma factor [Candidatus Eremiobacteraeota bacterium]